MRRSLGFATTALLVASACTFPRPPDIGDDPIDAAVDARPDLVTGSEYRRFLTRDGTVDGPFDLTSITVQALVPSAESPTGFVTRTGVGRADGTFEIEGVTPGVAYFLKLNRSIYSTEQHQVTLRSTEVVRTGVRLVTAPTPVSVTITDMPPATTTDVVTMESAFANIVVGFPGLSLNDGQTQAVASADWMTDGSAGIPDAAAGDELAIHQRRRIAPPGLPFVATIVATATVDPSTIVDGQAGSFTSALEVPARRLMLTSSLARSSLEAGHSPLASTSSLDVVCVAVPRPALSWSAQGGTELAPAQIFATGIAGWTAIGPTAVSLMGMYPDPYPVSWSRYCAVVYRRLHTLRLPGSTGSPASVSAGSFRLSTPDAATGSPLAPPAAIMVEGQNAENGGLIHNDGSPIELTWSGVAQATQYEVELQQLRSSGSGGTAIRTAATISSAEPRLTIPSELLAGSDFVAFTVTAVSAPNRYADGELLPEGAPGASATAVTAMFRYSATCGNGTVDLGEDCDGASASCDVDCTAAMCGDGTRNAAAGEICDSIEDTIGCDGDCTPNVCGDGHVNVNTEQCDDGGTTSGDGCSAACRSE